jgi:transcriptional regulator with XRE-family HTH domain
MRNVSRFDVEALYTAIDRRRRTHHLHFRDVAAQSGVSPSTLTRLGQGRHPDVDGLVRLLAWLGTTDLAPFLRTTEQLAIDLSEATSREGDTP